VNFDILEKLFGEIQLTQECEVIVRSVEVSQRWLEEAAPVPQDAPGGQLLQTVRYFGSISLLGETGHHHLKRLCTKTRREKHCIHKSLCLDTLDT